MNLVSGALGILMRNAIAIVFSLVSLAALAAGGTDPHYLAGVKAYGEDDHLKAAEELNTSLNERPNAKTALYLGNAYLKLGQLGKAREALELAYKLDPKSKKRTAIRKLIETIDARNVGVLRIVSSPPGATIRVDAETGGRGKTPMELSLSPGRYRLLAELDGHDPGSREDLLVELGETADVEFVLRALACDLSLAATPPTTQASIDGTPPVALPTKVSIAAGEHKIVFSADAFEPKEQTVTCDGHTPLALELTLKELRPPAPSPPVAVEKPTAPPPPPVAVALETPPQPLLPVLEPVKPAPPLPIAAKPTAEKQSIAAAIVPVAPKNPPTAESTPRRSRKWLWFTLGAVAVAGATVGMVYAFPIHNAPPSTTLGNAAAF